MGIVLDATENKLDDSVEDSQEEVRKRPERKISEVYISDLEMKHLQEIYSKSIVQDFNDDFHLSKEERERIEKEHEKLFRLKNMRNKCPRLSEYVIQWRLCIEIINEMAETNGVFKPEKFRKDVLSGRIYINGLRFPKYSGKRKKYINWDYIMDEYILDTSKDPYELDVDMMSYDDEDIDEDEVVEAHDPVVDEIVKKATLMSDREALRLVSKDVKSEGVATKISGKKLKEIKKLSPEVFRAISEQEKLERKRARARLSIYDVEEDDFEYIAKYDRKNRDSGKKIPKFKGDIMSTKDYDEYMKKLEDYEDDITLIKYNGRYYTPDEIQEIEVKQMLEENGWNLRKCFIDKEAEKRLKQQKKLDEKKAKKIKRMLAEINERKNARDEKLYGLPQGINIEKDKKSKKKKKKGKKKSKKDRKIRAFDDILLDASRSGYSSMDDYQEDMEDFSWTK